MTALATRARTGVVSYGSRTDVSFGCGNILAQAVFAGVDNASGMPSYAVRISNNSQYAVHAQVCFGTFAVVTDVSVAPFSIYETFVSAPPNDGNERAVVHVRGDGLAFSLDARPAIAPTRLATRLAGAFALCIASVIAMLCGVLFHSGAAGGTSALAAAAPAPPRVITRTHIVLRRVPAQPLLDELDVTPSAVAAGSPLRVRYGAHANGTIWLLDEQGRVWAKRAIDPSGELMLTVPENAAGRNLRVALTAQRGSQHAQISTGILVLPDGANLANLQPQSRAEPRVSPEHVASGNAIRVTLPAPHGEALVSITDTGGSIVEEVDVAPSQQTAVLHAPNVDAPSTYDVVVSIVRGHAQEQTVKAVTVLP